MRFCHWRLLLPACPIILLICQVAPPITGLQIPVPIRNDAARQRSASALRLSTPTSSTETPEFAGAFDSDQMDALQQRGELEASLMQPSFQGPLEAPGAKKKKKAPSAPTFVRELKREGVVRVNNALSGSTAALLRADILERRAKAYDAVAAGEDWRKYFADVLLKSNRCDLLLPLEDNPMLQTALQELLSDSSTLPKVLTSMLTENAPLYELAALVSEPGSPRQPVHPDNPHQQHPPLLTCFIALQDIHSEMGPTIFLPKTHTQVAHDRFDDITFSDVSNRDNMLKETPHVAAHLNAGDVAVFDSRTMHCGGANTLSTRALLYFSFRNPSATESVGNVGSILPEIPPMTLGKLREELGKM